VGVHPAAGYVESMTISRLPTLMIPHGGGPCFWMSPTDPQPPSIWDGLGAHLRGLAAEIGERPKAILVISAHWETPTPTVLAAERHSLLFDYNGFPEHTYRLTYPATGAPELAGRVQNLLAGAGMASASESDRGLDHGVFVPFKLIYPAAEVPIAQLSLCDDLDPERHLAIGRALAPLRDEGVLIVGSGLTFHNFWSRDQANLAEGSVVFDDWLTAAVEAPADRRDRELIHWAQAPGARLAHPREEHLLPLMVAAGAAGGDVGRKIYGERLAGAMANSGYRFG